MSAAVVDTSTARGAAAMHRRVWVRRRSTCPVCGEARTNPVHARPGRVLVPRVQICLPCRHVAEDLVAALGLPPDQPQRGQDEAGEGDL